MATRNMDRLRDEALELPQADRAELAHDLVKSLDGPADPPATVTNAWEEEILRRLDEVEAGTAKTVNREEFAKRVRERISRL